MFAFTNIRQFFNPISSRSTHTPSKKMFPCSVVLTQPSIASPTIFPVAPNKAPLPKNEDSAFDLLFAVYHYYYLETNVPYKDWRRPKVKQVASPNSAPIYIPASTIAPEDKFDALIALVEPTISTISAISTISEDTDSSSSSRDSRAFAFSDEDQHNSDEDSLTSVYSEDSEDDLTEANFKRHSIIVHVEPAIPPHMERYRLRKPSGLDDVGPGPIVVDDIDAHPKYKARHLTTRARKEAERRSRCIKTSARRTARELRRITPLKASQHPEPVGIAPPAVLKDLGLSSHLHASWTLEEDVPA